MDSNAIDQKGLIVVLTAATHHPIIQPTVELNHQLNDQAIASNDIQRENQTFT